MNKTNIYTIQYVLINDLITYVVRVNGRVVKVISNSEYVNSIKDDMR